MKVNSTKKTLLMSALSLLLCFSMLIGTTYAWFTDSVTSANNKIVAGNLKIDLEILEKDGSWTSVKETSKPIFNYDLWEPGYTDIKILRVSNKGTLALKWIAKFVSAYELSALADVIDVYVNDSVNAYPDDREDLDSWTKIGSLRKFVNTISATTKGTLEAGASANLGIALKMQETAGNEYQGMSLGGLFDIQILATQYTSETDSFGKDYDENAEYLEGLLSASFKMLGDPDTTIRIFGGEIVVSRGGAVQAVIPATNLAVNGNVFTVSGTNGMDGVYTIGEDGYVEKDGVLIAKSEQTWVDVPNGDYFVVHDGEVYYSEDGNTPDVANGPLMKFDELGMSVNQFLAANGGDLDAIEQAYGYRFSEYNGEFTVENLFDVLAIQNITEKGEFRFGIYTGRYDYWGGTARDEKSDTALVSKVNWSETDLDAIVTTALYEITEDGRKPVPASQAVLGGTYEAVQEIKYYHNGIETENVMFFEDYALYFEDGMTYGEWMRKYFIMELHDMCDGMHDHNGIYIPEEYLDDLCQPGYSGVLQSPPDRIYNDYFGYYSENGKAWNMELIFYSYGKTHIRPTNFEEEGYQYLGMAWEGGLQEDGTIYADEYYNYFIRKGETPKAVPFYSAFKAAGGTTVDISSYLSKNSSNQIEVNVEALKNAYGLDGQISIIPVYEKDGYLVDCRTIGCTYNAEIGGNYYEAEEVFLSNICSANNATGITFYFNGVVYTGFAN